MALAKALTGLWTACARAGNYSPQHLDGCINLLMGEMFALRAAAMRETRDGFFSNGGRASDRTAGRLKPLVELQADLTSLATPDSFDSKGADGASVPRASAGGPPFFNWKTNGASPWDVDPHHPADVKRRRHVETDTEAGIAAQGGALLQPLGRMLNTDPRTFGANLSDKF